ncbi:hypothetical protein sphantq_03928 [Sphingobium sp. AntQ-1]|uniref:alpha-L-rhamnosidase-related protein n=1 Tax=Sphingobium sp. AntQ-1 TaxID=2930091 RepID=UPI00234EC7A2|nr:hypothetical protein [Sphingobium sp. AntQ-1]WCP15461.1 hypothetical protein sphantq_03928 [Sphingobium sp. AntQ-1]
MQGQSLAIRRRQILGGALGVTFATLLAGPKVLAQNSRFAPAIAGEPNAEWARKADALMPTLHSIEQQPVALVNMIPDPAQILRFRVEKAATIADFATRSFRKGDSFILDFEGHRTGYLSFDLETVGREPDAPVRLKLTFGEVQTDVAEPLHPYKGKISEAWLPEEIITVDYLPQSVKMARRYAFRYVRVDVIDTSPGFAVKFLNVRAHAVTSAGPMPAPMGATPRLRRMDEVAMATLRDCMQTSFEDGPRRDQRLWVGDLRLQALANYASFQNNDLVKRCLYLFAAYRDKDGLVAACVYEKPHPRYGGMHIVDYAALFNVTLRDYVLATGDVATGRDLWPVARRQLELIARWINADGLFVDPGNMWIFIDWADKLDKGAAIQGLLTFAWRATAELARRLGMKQEDASLSHRAGTMTTAGRAAYWDAHSGRVVSGPRRQVSWAGASWMMLGGLLSPREGRKALFATLDDPAAIKPSTPYLYHYVVEALIACGEKKRAMALLESYWVAMIDAGVDTFWEVFDPTTPLSSPYGDIHINSYCHAWSCTPSYFLRQKLS